MPRAWAHFYFQQRNLSTHSSFLCDSPIDSNSQLHQFFVHVSSVPFPTWIYLQVPPELPCSLALLVNFEALHIGSGRIHFYWLFYLLSYSFLTLSIELYAVAALLDWDGTKFAGQRWEIGNVLNFRDESIQFLEYAIVDLRRYHHLFVFISSTRFTMDVLMIYNTGYVHDEIDDVKSQIYSLGYGLGVWTYFWFGCFHFQLLNDFELNCTETIFYRNLLNKPKETVTMIW